MKRGLLLAGVLVASSVFAAGEVTRYEDAVLELGGASKELKIRAHKVNGEVQREDVTHYENAQLELGGGELKVTGDRVTTETREVQPEVFQDAEFSDERMSLKCKVCDCSGGQCVCTDCEIVISK